LLYKLTMHRQPTVSNEEIYEKLGQVVGKETSDKIKAMVENPGDKKATVTCPVSGAYRCVMVAHSKIS
jgi:hypothetical protein